MFTNLHKGSCTGELGPTIPCQLLLFRCPQRKQLRNFQPGIDISYSPTMFWWHIQRDSNDENYYLRQESADEHLYIQPTPERKNVMSMRLTFVRIGILECDSELMRPANFSTLFKAYKCTKIRLCVKYLNSTRPSCIQKNFSSRIPF